MRSSTAESIRAGVRRTIVSLLWRPRLTVLIGAVAIAFPAIVAVVRLSGQQWYPTGDFSHTELMLRSIPQHPPLLGVAARVGDGLLDQGSTPGPSMAYLLYPVYLLGGRTSISMVGAVLLLHLLAIVFSLYVTSLLGGWRAVWAMAIGFSVVVQALSPDFFLEPWNVWVPLLAFALFVLLVWGVILGHRWMLLAAVIVGTHCLQTHVSYIPLVMLGLLIAVVPVVRVGLMGSDRGITRWWPLVASTLALIVMWLPPIVEQMTSERGNLGRLWEHFSNPSERTVGVAGALRALSGEFNLAGPFIVGPGHLPTESPNLWGALGFLVLVGTGVAMARRSGDRRILSLYGLLAVMTVVGFVATARVFGTFYEYVIRWMWVLAMLWLACSLWALVTSIVASRPRRLVMATGCALSAVLVVSASLAGATPPLDRDSRVVRELARQLEESLDPSQRYLLRWHDPAALGGTGFGLVLAMAKRGVSLYVDSWAGAAAQKHRVRAVDETNAVLCLNVGPENISRFASRPDVQRVADADPRSPSEIEESSDLRKDIEAGLTESDRPDLLDLLDSQYGHTQVLMDPDLSPELQRSVLRYNDLRLPAAVFVAPRGSLCMP